MNSKKRIFADILAERRRQDEKWGVQRHPWPVWMAILGEEFGEACKAAMDTALCGCMSIKELREELVQVAAVAVEIIEHIDEVLAKGADTCRLNEVG